VIGSTLLLPARHMMRIVALRDDAVFAKWDEQLVARHPFTPVGGGDAHANIQAFGPLGGTIAGYPEVFLSISTHVLAKERTESAIVDAMRRGRAYVSFDVNGEGTGFDFRAQHRDGSIALPGDTIAARECAQLCAVTPLAAKIRFFRDGRLVAQHSGSEAVLRDPEPGVYRVEAWTESGAPWLFSSSIRVAAAATATQPSTGSAFQ
jgi:hypothetical protein